MLISQYRKDFNNVNIPEYCYLKRALVHVPNQKLSTCSFGSDFNIKAKIEKKVTLTAA